MVRLAEGQGRAPRVNARARLTIRGAVQGVGFRPFVYRLATGLDLAGWVLNSAQGVLIEVEGERARLDDFLVRIERDRPPRAAVHSLESTLLDPVGYCGFEIRESDAREPPTALVLPDIATCDDCLREILDPADRRHRYAFTNCTNCGPRFSIVDALPYDRANTSMRGFAMCAACRREYDDPLDRRFHAQPNACPACGPQLALWSAAGDTLAERDAALAAAVQAIGAGRLVAVKGLGGFHLVADAGDAAAVDTLRARKHREEKPLALMYPTPSLVERDCEVSALEARLLAAPEAPIVLLRRRPVADRAIAPGVAPGNPYLGVMLPSTPLHHLLLRDLGRPIVATSGNLSDEPICTGEREALARLNGLADLFLVHDRPILRHVDDSIARVLLGRELVLRRARGYAPLPIRLRNPVPPTLAVGAHLKNAVAVALDRHVFLSQHIGDLETAQATEAFERVIDSFHRLYQVTPARVVADLHPDYLSTRWARRQPAPLVQIQHHVAHVAACMAENDLHGRVLGVSWDGTGFGPDGTVWGGEFFLMDDHVWRRVATLRTFALPGGEAAVKEPRRAALGLLHATLGDAVWDRDDLEPVTAFDAGERRVLRGMLDRGLNAPRTSSVGRLFDAVAAIAGLRQRTSFEGQTAMALEFAVRDDEVVEGAYAFALEETPAEGGTDGLDGRLLVVDWRPVVRGVLEDVRSGVPAGPIAARFHRGLAEIIVRVATRIGQPRVALTGGCFQNRILIEQAVERLARAGFRPYWHQRVPPNDGGIALGQIVAASHEEHKGPTHVSRGTREDRQHRRH